jgi:2-polyprenyl-6-hydroxyphenyl methylase/3-demethylubiquinone-9 3-methyltransferase
MAGSISRLGRRAFKLVYIVYYRLLFGRRFPFSDRLARAVARWEAETRRGDVPVSKERWEEEYAGGKWELMRAFDELARYSVIAGYLHHLHPRGSVLDVGSGEGLLCDHLRPWGYSRFHGVDLSEAAIAQAAPRGDERTTFSAADAERYLPEGRFDAIVFNECVYYFQDPIGTVQRYRAHLEPGGSLIISMFRGRRAETIAKRLREALTLVEETAITNRKGTWVVRVYR